MIGIDIIDLSDPKITKREERAFDFILNPLDIFPKVPGSFWLLWTAKEAIYKCQRPTTSFSPSKIHVTIDGETSGVFNFKSNEIHGVIYLNPHFVLAVCANSQNLPMYRIYYRTTGDLRCYIREKVKSHLGQGQAMINDTLGLPAISPGMQVISISHHHRYTAFAAASQTFQ
jgi:hypothetical protein